MHYKFHWYQAFRALPQMLDASLVTLQGAVLAMVIGTMLAILLALGRNSKNKAARGFSTAWVEIARNTPALYQIYMAYFGLGSLGIHLDSFPALMAGISFSNAGYLAETFRGGLRAVPSTQNRAARSLGMTRPMAFRLVIFPQLLRHVYYPMTNQMVWSMLLTSLGVVVGLSTDLMGVTQQLSVVSFRTFEYFLIAAGLYYFIAKALTGSARLIGWRLFSW